MEKTDVSINEIKTNFHPLTAEEQFLMYMRLRDCESFYCDEMVKANKPTEKEKYSHILETVRYFTTFMTGGNEIADNLREFNINKARKDMDERTSYTLVEKK